MSANDIAKMPVDRPNGLWITFEGGEGSGKGTQIKLLEEFLRSQGHDPLVVRDPGSTPEAEKIRNLLVTGEPGQWTNTTELLLFLAARAELYERLIAPALASNCIVLTDRYADSTRVYQCIVKGFSLATMNAMDSMLFGDRQPDTTFILDVDPEIGLQRTRKRNTVTADGVAEDRFEKEGLAFHRKIRDGYRYLNHFYLDRCILLDANQSSIDSVQHMIRVILGERYPLQHMGLK